MWSGSIEPLDDSVEGTDRDRNSFSTTSELAGVVNTTGSVDATDAATSPVDAWLASTRWTREDIALITDVILAAGVTVPIVVKAYQQL